MAGRAALGANRTFGIRRIVEGPMTDISLRPWRSSGLSGSSGRRSIVRNRRSQRVCTGTIRKNRITNLLARARSSSAWAKSRSAHRPNIVPNPNFQRHEKRSGATRVLSSSPTSKSQSSGASRMGSHSVAPHDIQHLEGACNQRSHPPLEATDLSERIPPL